MDFYFDCIKILSMLIIFCNISSLSLTSSGMQLRIPTPETTTAERKCLTEIPLRESTEFNFRTAGPRSVNIILFFCLFV